MELPSHRMIVGVDEAGTGAWAGPACVGVVLADAVRWPWHPEVTDSKALTDKRREELADTIHMASWVVWVWPDEIDRVGLGNAMRAAYVAGIEAALARSSFPDQTLVVVDGNQQVHPRALAIPKADATVKAVSMASIYAKVARDRFMKKAAHNWFPQYAFQDHVGYGTAAHQQALDLHGPCDLHRMSYKPLSKYLR